MNYSILSVSHPTICTILVGLLGAGVASLLGFLSWFCVGLVLGAALGACLPALRLDALSLLLSLVLLGFAALAAAAFLLTLLQLNQVRIWAFLSLSPAGASALGISAEFATTCHIDLARSDALKQRFASQSVARRVLGDGWRLWHCLRTPINSSVDVLYRPDVARAEFGGLQRCASPHVCPCCSATISHRRAAEIDAAVSLWESEGGAVLLSTFTLQHTAAESLAVVGDRLLASFRRVRSGRQWSLFAGRHGLAGSVKSVEYTYGLSGWHPHLHVIWFVQSGGGASEQRAMAGWLRSRWAAVVRSHGGYAHELVGCDTRAAGSGSAALGGYLTKLGNSWTVGDEVARANRKQSRAAGGMTPAMLLAAADDGDERAAALFAEYAVYTHGRDSLRWARGFRARVGLDSELADADLVRGDSLGAVVVVTLDRVSWRMLLGSAVVGRAELLAACESLRGDSVALSAWLAQQGIMLLSVDLAA